MVPGSLGPCGYGTLAGGWLYGCGSACGLGFWDLDLPFPELWLGLLLSVVWEILFCQGLGRRSGELPTSVGSSCLILLA